MFEKSKPETKNPLKKTLKSAALAGITLATLNTGFNPEKALAIPTTADYEARFERVKNVNTTKITQETFLNDLAAYSKRNMPIPDTTESSGLAIFYGSNQIGTINTKWSDLKINGESFTDYATVLPDTTRPADTAGRPQIFPKLLNSNLSQYILKPDLGKSGLFKTSDENMIFDLARQRIVDHSNYGKETMVFSNATAQFYKTLSTIKQNDPALAKAQGWNGTQTARPENLGVPQGQKLSPIIQEIDGGVLMIHDLSALSHPITINNSHLTIMGGIEEKEIKDPKTGKIKVISTYEELKRLVKMEENCNITIRAQGSDPESVRRFNMKVATEIKEKYQAYLESKGLAAPLPPIEAKPPSANKPAIETTKAESNFGFTVSQRDMTPTELATTENKAIFNSNGSAINRIKTGDTIVVQINIPKLKELNLKMIISSRDINAENQDTPWNIIAESSSLNGKIINLKIQKPTQSGTLTQITYALVKISDKDQMYKIDRPTLNFNQDDTK
jgi:hypothetical protein